MQTNGSYFSEGKMKNRSTIFSDLSKMAQGAASIADEMRIEVKNIINARNQRKQNESNLVTYEDFEALTTRLESLISRIELLEIKIENAKTVKKQKSTVSKIDEGKATFLFSLSLFLSKKKKVLTPRMINPRIGIIKLFFIFF